jgi:MHS family proline/betaine transporter-like MFS transporter
MIGSVLVVLGPAGTAATVIGALVLASGDRNWPGYYLMTAGVVGANAVWLLAESARRPLAGSGPAVSSEAEARALIAERQVS